MSKQGSKRVVRFRGTRVLVPGYEGISSGYEGISAGYKRISAGVGED